MTTLSELKNEDIFSRVARQMAVDFAKQRKQWENGIYRTEYYNEKWWCPFYTVCTYDKTCSRALTGKIIAAARKKNSQIKIATCKPICFERKKNDTRKQRHLGGQIKCEIKL
jgi:hypothetical protein